MYLSFSGILKGQWFPAIPLIILGSSWFSGWVSEFDPQVKLVAGNLRKVCTYNMSLPQKVPVNLNEGDPKKLLMNPNPSK